MEIPVELQEIIDPDRECCCAYCFSNKCKEWAFDKYTFSIVTQKEMTHWGGAWYIEITDNFNNSVFKQSTHNTEPEAVFTACQWILDNREKD